MSNEIIFFSAFTVFILAMLLLDLGVFSKKSHVISFKEAGIWSAVWVVLALGFYFLITTHGDLIHGIKDFAELKATQAQYAPEVDLTDNYQESLEIYKDNMALEFITGYLLEYSLSADNIFVIIMIFSSFGVRQKYYKKVLFWGILGALIMRFAFIFLGSALIQNFHQILYIFGGFLLFTGVRSFINRNKEEKIEPRKHPLVRLAARYFAVFPRYVKDYFFIKKNHKLMLTPLFIVLLIVEFTDLIFAVDSVPAVFAVTKDPYIVFFSNIFAIMGLRSMFFFLSNIMYLFHYLKIGLSFLLIFIGTKMILGHWLKTIGFKTSYSIFIILGILAVSIISSLLFPPKPKEESII